MLQLKVNLYKEGIVDFKLQPEVQGRQIILTAVPKTKKEVKLYNINYCFMIY